MKKKLHTQSILILFGAMWLGVIPFCVSAQDGCAPPHMPTVPDTYEVCSSTETGTIMVINAPVGYNHLVYNASNQLLSEQVAGSYAISFGPYPVGTYTVKVQNKCILSTFYSAGTCQIKVKTSTPPSGSAVPSVPFSTQFCDQSPGDLTIEAGNGNNYVWTINGSNYSSGQTFEYPFDHPTHGTIGTHNVRVDYMVPGAGCNGEAVPVYVDNMPVRIVAEPTTANAGSDLNRCEGSQVTLPGNTPSVGLGTWSIVSGSGGYFEGIPGTIGSTNPSATFSGVAGATYVLKWSISNGSCTPSTDNMNVTFVRQPTVAAAGPDQTSSATCGLTTVTLAANTPTIGTGTWSVVSGSGGSFTNSSSPTTTFTGTPGSTYILRWTISNNPCVPTTDDVTIKFNQYPTTASAGPDQTNASTCGLTTVTLAGNNPLAGTGSWTIVSGTNGSVTNPSARNSTFSGVAGNTYVLRWTISSGPCGSSFDEVNIKFNKNPTTANAGPDQTGEATCGLTSVTLSGNSPTTGTGTWSFLVGNGTLANAAVHNTSLTGTPGEIYWLTWRITNAPCPPSQDYAIVILNVKPTTTAVVTGNHRFGQGPLELSATGAQSAETFKWFAPTGSPLLFTGSPYVTPSVDSPVLNYCYVQTANEYCLGEKTWVNTYVYPVPVITSDTDRILPASPAMLSTGENYDSYTWRNQSGNIVGTTSTIPVSAPGNYTVTVTKGGISATSAPLKLLHQFEGLDENYILTYSSLESHITTTQEVETKSIGEVSQNIQYFDGLGRHMQTVMTQGSPSKLDIVQPIVYDAFGREAKKYLPFTAQNDGWYKPNNEIINLETGDYIGIAETFYNNEDSKIADDGNRPFAETIFESSPLNRMLKQGGPGTAWKPVPDAYSTSDNTIKTRYEVNKADEVLLFRYETTGEVSLDADPAEQYYAINTLFVNKTYDEHNNEVIEYIDKIGRTVCKKVQYDVDDSEKKYASTYYLYDDFGNLVVVLPPEAVEELLAQ